MEKCVEVNVKEIEFTYDSKKERYIAQIEITNILDKKQLSNTAKFSNVLHTVKAMSDQFAHKTKDIHVNIILVKSDIGYIPKDVQEDEVKLKDMVINQMGMAAEVMDLENTYASLHFYAVSSLKDKGIEKLTSGIIDDLNVKL